MGFIGGVKVVLKFLPDLISIVKTIWGWVQQGIADAEIKRRLALFDQAAQIAKDTKDTSKLEDLFGGGTPPRSK